MYSSAYVWAKILNHIEEQLGPVIVSAAFDDAEVVELNEDNLILYSPSDFRRDLIRRRYALPIQDALKEILWIIHCKNAYFPAFSEGQKQQFHNT